MDDHLPSGSPPQQHLSIGLGIEPFTGLSGWLLGRLAGYPTQEIYMMIAILGKYGQNISSEYWRNVDLHLIIQCQICNMWGHYGGITIINLPSKIVDFLQHVIFILALLFWWLMVKKNKIIFSLRNLQFVFVTLKAFVSPWNLYWRTAH